MKRILAQINRRDAHPAIQFIKYALCGGVATAVDFLLFFFISIFINVKKQSIEIFFFNINLKNTSKKLSACPG